MRDFISVVPFFACKAPGCSHPGERNRHLHLIRSTEFGTSPDQRQEAQHRVRPYALRQPVEHRRNVDL
jgi:hypothetical protein